MKKYLKHKILGCLAFGTLLLLPASCTDYLERTPEASIPEGAAFINFTNFQGFVEELYCCVVDMTGVNWACSWFLGDEIIHSDNGVWLNDAYDKGDYWFTFGWTSYLGIVNTPDTNPTASTNKAVWPLSWYALRKLNMGLENLDKFVDATQEERDILEGQMLFFRGFFHFELMSYWGGMPYIDRAFPADEKLELPRLSCQETADRIAEDLRKAADLLPIDWDKTTVGERTLGRNQQRVNKLTALGYLGKTYLYAGSPLYNRESTGSATFNAEYCKKAAEAFGELLTIVDSGQTWVKLVDFEDYNTLWLSWGRNFALPGYPEALWQAPMYDPWLAGCPWGQLSIFPESKGSVSPNARYVENFGMANGLPIDDPESGYDIRDPYAGRDPRFYNDIVYDGVQITLNVKTDNGKPMPETQFARLYTGGASRDNTKVGRTGYIMRKLSPIDANDVDNQWDGKGFLMLSYLRLADVYLMYAEAVLQGYGSSTAKAVGYDMTAVEAVNKIRTRAGVGPVADKYQASNELFMGEIIRERAVELAFETNQRWHDIRRWLLAGELKYREKTSHEFDRGPDGKPVNFREQVILTRVWDEKFYWLPLQVDDVALYPSFGQNPGW